MSTFEAVDCPTYREFDEGVCRRAAHVEFGPEKRREGGLLTHGLPLAFSLKTVKGEHRLYFY